MPRRLTSQERRARLQAELDKGHLTVADLQILIDQNTPAADAAEAPTTGQRKVVPASAKDSEFHFNLESVLSFTGAAIVGFGILVLLSFNWTRLTETGQVLATLGTGLFLALSSIFLQPILKKTFYLNLTQLLAALFIGGGIGVFVTNTEPTAPLGLVYAACFGFVSLVYTILDRTYRRGVWLFLGLSYFAAGYTALVIHFLDRYEERYNLLDKRVPQIAFLFLSLFFLQIALRVWSSPRTFFRAVILNLGAIGTMITSFLAIQRYDWSESAAWRGSVLLEHAYAGVFLVFYYVATRLSSKFLLLSTSIGLFVWLNYLLNVRYDLSNNLGVGLIISGLLLILIGFLTYRLGALFPRRRKRPELERTGSS